MTAQPDSTSVRRDGQPQIASDARIDPGAVVEPGCAIGARSTVARGAFLGAGTLLAEDVVVGPNATFEPAVAREVAAQAREGARVGANATICAGVTLSSLCLVRPGAVVTRSVPPRAIVEGNPAIITGYVDTEPRVPVPSSVERPPAGVESTPVRGVTVHRFPVIPDLRGNLTVGEFEREIPFLPRRYFMVFGVPSREIRGEHAHLECHQFLLCVRGSCSVVADDGARRMEITLDRPDVGLHLPPMTWGIQYKYTADAMLLVFASHHYDAEDYIRSYDDFLAAASTRAGA